MKNIMIDADALLDWIEVQSKKNYAKTFNSFFTSADFIKQEITRLKSLASVAPEPQEQVIDIYNTKINGNSIFYNLSEKIGDLKTSYGLKKIERTREQKVSEMSLYNFIDYIFSGKYKKYECVDFEPQQSIFDADGDWCYDLKTVLSKMVTLFVVNKKDNSKHIFKNCIYTDNSVFEDSSRAYFIIKTNNTIEPLECHIKEKLQIDEVDYEYIKILAYKMPTLPREA